MCDSSLKVTLRKRTREAAALEPLDVPRRPRRPVAAEVPPESPLSPVVTSYLERFQQLKSAQLRRLQAVTEQQALAASPANVSERFRLLMQQVSAFTSTDKQLQNPSASSKRSGTHRCSQGVAEDDGDDGGEEEVGGYLTKQPSYLTGAMRPYQLEGLNWLVHLFDSALNGILADEMGLGKTFQCVALLGYLKMSRNIPGPHLVICPLSVTSNWVSEIRRWCPSLSVLLFHGYKDARDALRLELKSGIHDVVVTTYETVNMEKGSLGKLSWRYIIVDEAHRLKNEESLLSRTLRLFRSNHRLLVTGTPLQNNLHELWALLNFLLPELFENAEDFDRWFDVREGVQEKDIISQLHKLLKPFMLRRLKCDAAADLPPKKEIYISCGLSGMQRDWYARVLAKDAQVVNQGGSMSRLKNVLMQLRKVCDHPYLFEGAEPGPPFVTDETIVESSGKMILLDRLLARLKQQGHRVLLFCQMTRMMDILEDYLGMRGYQYCRLDGSTSPMERVDAMEVFNAPDSPLFLFMLSTRAGGLGINLHSADTVILYDSDWNPQVDLQAQDRAHRIGQKKPVTVFRFITDGTVEEKIYQRALKKLYLDAAVIQQGRLQERPSAASREELLGMIRFGAEQIFRSKDALTITDEDIDIILQRGESKQQSLSSKLEKNCQMSLLNFSMGIEDANIYEFEGVNYTDQPTKTIYIRGIDASVVEADIREVFFPFGELKKVVISPERDAAAVTM
eukprot:RCo023151